MADTANPIENAVADDAAEAKRGRYGWLSLIVAAVLGLFYAYDVWEAIGNMINLPTYYHAIGIAAKVPWWLLWIGVAIPIVVFLLAFIVGRHRNVGGKAVVFIVGLALAAGLGIGVLSLEAVLRPPVVAMQSN
ncbi:MAG: hypothetical protein ABJA94_04560 [Rhodoglobus sp.]